MCPGLPRESNRYCDRVGRVMNYGDGLYGGMFVCGMYAPPTSRSDPRRGRSRPRLHPREERVRPARPDLLDAGMASSRTTGARSGSSSRTSGTRTTPAPTASTPPSTSMPSSTAPTSRSACSSAAAISRRPWRSAPAAARTRTAIPRAPPACSVSCSAYERIPRHLQGRAAEVREHEVRFHRLLVQRHREVHGDPRAQDHPRQTGGQVTRHRGPIKTQSPRRRSWNNGRPGFPDRRIGAGDAAWTWTAPGRTTGCEAQRGRRQRGRAQVRRRGGGGDRAN
jgi:hypothetical protein